MRYDFVAGTQCDVLGWAMMHDVAQQMDNYHLQTRGAFFK